MFNEVLTQNHISIAKAARLLDQTQFRSEISSDLMRRSDWRFRLNDVNAFPERTLYLHLPRHYAAQERRSTPFTPAVQLAYALHAALEELESESVDGRINRYLRASTIIRRGLAGLGFELLLPEALRSTTMTSVTLPLGVSYEHLHDALKRSGFVIYAGQGPLAASIFRVAAMGDVAEADYRRFVATLGAVVS